MIEHCQVKKSDSPLNEPTHCATRARVRATRSSASEALRHMRIAAA